MITSIFRFSLDLHSLHSQVTIPAFQGDTSITLYITITDGGRPVTLPTGCLAKLTIKRPTGTYLEDFCMIQDNHTIVYPFAQNEGTCAVEGINECDITLFSSQGGNVGSPRFTIMVAEKVMKKDDIVIADEDYKIAEAMATAEAARQLAETGRVEAEAARVEAENARSAAEQGRVDADAVREELLTGINDRLSTLEDGHTIDHRKLTDRDAEDAHPISAITGLPEVLEQFGTAADQFGERLTEVESDVSTLLDNIDAAGESPTFDLIALGLPAVGPSNGFQGVTCDTSEIRAALDKGAVQFKVKLLRPDGVTEYEATILMGSIETVGDGGSKAFTCSCRASGNYELGAEGISLTDFAELTIMVTEVNVMAVMANLLHVPSVTESANGKVLQVVDGKWQAAEAPKGADVVVDAELSETSENPVQNKVITQTMNAFAEGVGKALENISSATPTFNLSEMGLQPIEVNRTQSLSVETSDILAALERGSVKFILDISLGMTVEIGVVMNSIGVAGEQVCTCMAVINDVYLLNLSFTLGEISASFIQFGNMLLPPVSSGDEGKLLQVVGGKWEAVLLTDVSVEGA